MITEDRRMPQEIFDNIIDHVASSKDTEMDNTKVALRSCALVSSAWLSTARAHIFETVILEPPTSKAKPVKRRTAVFNILIGYTTAPQPDIAVPTESQCEKLLALLESYNTNQKLGSIAPYIRRLLILEGRIPSTTSWWAHEQALPSILHRLPNLDRFELGRRAASTSLIQWGEQSAAFKDAVQNHVFGLSTLTALKLGSLQFNDVTEVADLLKNCQMLRVLEVEHLSLQQEILMDAPATSSGTSIKIPLDVLVLGHRTSMTFIRFLSHSRSPIALSTIRKLSMSISDDFVDFAKLLSSSASLEHLE